MSDRDAFRAEQQERRRAGKAKQHEKRLENATYTAAEVKVLTETATKLGYELGYKRAAITIADDIEARAEDGTWNMGGQVCLQVAVNIARRHASQPSGAVSDERSGNPWIEGRVSTEEYFTQARANARAEAQAEVAGDLAKGDA